MARSLLSFAKGEKLGADGLDWLKVMKTSAPAFTRAEAAILCLFVHLSFQIHCINLTGLKKRCSTEERLQYANEILPSILDSAENPLTVSLKSLN